MFNSAINDLHKLPIQKYEDLRGSLNKISQQVNFQTQEVFYTSNEEGTFRGMHLQWGEHSTSKLLTLIRGSIVQYLLDCRPNSSTYMNIHKIHHDSKNESFSIYIPEGVAQGYVSMETNSLVLYQMSGEFCSTCDTGLKSEEILEDAKSLIGVELRQSQRDLQLPEILEVKCH